MPLYVREIILTAFWTLAFGISVWLIVVGATPAYENVAWGAMLLLGVAGIMVLIHGLRINAAVHLEYIPSSVIRRHLRLHKRKSNA